MSDKLNIFGSNHDVVGTSQANLILRTAGKIKIQWGNKFIDLIKDGKINVESSFIFKGKIGSKDGIYLTDNGIYLKVKDQVVNLVGEVGTTYVSFFGEQETDSNSKYTALRNIGFIYPDISSFNNNSLQNGIIYVESEHKLYIVQNGQLTEFRMQFPNPFTEQFIIQKNDSLEGAILIKGSGITNSLAFDSFYIFTEEGKSYLRSNGEINIMLNNEAYINITRNKTIIKNIVESNTFQSKGANQDNGFKLSLEDGQSTLIVDNFIVRNSSSSVQPNIYPTYWSLQHNVIVNIEPVEDEEKTYNISLKYKNEYNVGDFLYIYEDIIPEDGNIEVVKIPMEVKVLNSETSIQVKILTDISSIIGINKITFLVGSQEKLNLIRYSEHSIDLLECQNLDDSSVQARFGDLSDLQLKEEKDSESSVSGLGIYAKQGYFNKLAYVSEYKLLEDDNSTKIASTEWTRNLINNIFPSGIIMAFHGNNIPNGWVICDGNNETPNLIDKFVKEDSESDQTIKIDLEYYSLVFIMKI